MIDVLNLPPGEILKACPQITDYQCFMEFMQANKAAEPDDKVPVRETIVFIILLYDKGSFLNKKPIEALQTRLVKAAKLAGLDPEDENIQSKILYLENEAVRNCVVDYLLLQSDYNWSDRCAIASQMAENLRIRMKPIEKEKADKDILNKHTLTEQYRDYGNQIKKLDAEIFIGHDNVRDIAVRKRTTIESLIK